MAVISERTRTFNFGKIAYWGKRKDNAVEVQITLYEKTEGPAFTASASIWNARKSDIVCAGQCLDTLLPYFKNNATFMKIFGLWKRYHLNDLNVGTPKQEEALRECGKQSASYDEQLEALRGLGLSTVTLPDGTSYTYGHGWLYRPIPAECLADIEQLLAE